MLQRYACLGVSLNGSLLREQCGVQIVDHVNRRCRVRVEMVVPQAGPEVDARARLGEVVDIGVHIVRGHRLDDVGAPIVTVRGPIIESFVATTPDGFVTWAFVVEDRQPETE